MIISLILAHSSRLHNSFSSDRYMGHLPLATLFQAPTISELASVLSREQWVPPWHRWWRFSRAERDPDFHGAGVEAMSWLCPVGEAVGQNQPFYGLQPRGLMGKSAVYSVPEMARHFSKIKTGPKRPMSPRYCTGGLIAYEWLSS
jgi:hypothetical protein